MAVEDSVAQDQIRAFIERIERLEEEKAALAEDIKSIYAEAKGNGFHTKTLRKVVNIRKQDANERMEQEALLELYMSALGMVPAPPSYDEERDRLNSLASKIEADLRKPKAEPDPIAALKTNPDLHIVDPSNLKNKSEPQPPVSAGSDLTSSQALNGQVATHPVANVEKDADGTEAAASVDPASREVDDADRQQVAASGFSGEGGVGNPVPTTNPEAKTSTDGGATEQDREMPADSVTGEVSRASVGAGPDASLSEPAREGGSQSQESAGPGPDAAAPSSGEAQPKYAAPGVIVWETSPPEGVERGVISMAFGAMGQDTAVIADDLEKGRAQPIIKQGNVILDGWARYMAVRNMRELDGSPVAYQVVQYDGQDLLTDIIKLNVEGRMLTEQQKRQIAANLARQEPSRKDDIYRAFELWMEPV